MGLEYQAVASLDHPAERARLLRRIADDLAMIEFDAGLDDGRDHARPGLRETGLGENRAMHVDGRARCLGRRDGKSAQLFRGAAWNRNLGADDIDGRLAARARMCPFSDRT